MRSDSGSGRPSFHPEPFRASWRGSHSLTYGNTHTQHADKAHFKSARSRSCACNLDISKNLVLSEQRGSGATVFCRAQTLGDDFSPFGPI